MLKKISIGTISGAVVYLIYTLNQTLQKGMGTLEETNKTLAEVRNAVHGLTEESKQLIHTANQITVDVKGKIRNVDPLLESAQDVGEMIHNVTHSIKEASKSGKPPSDSINVPSTPTVPSQPSAPLIKQEGVHIKLK